MTPVPAHQLCTDCKINKRALAEGVTGYGCLCVDCYNARIEAAKRKKKPSPKQKALESHPYSPELYESLRERVGKDAALDNWEEL
jgi:hypothetical protein